MNTGVDLQVPSRLNQTTDFDLLNRIDHHACRTGQIAQQRDVLTEEMGPLRCDQDTGFRDAQVFCPQIKRVGHLQTTRYGQVACGLDEQEARARSLLLYAYVFGVSLMRPGSFAGDLASLRTWIAGHIAR